MYYARLGRLTAAGCFALLASLAHAPVATAKVFRGGPRQAGNRFDRRAELRPGGSAVGGGWSRCAGFRHQDGRNRLAAPLAGQDRKHSSQAGRTLGCQAPTASKSSIWR